MKRRDFSVLAGTAAIAAAAKQNAVAQTTVPDASLLTTTLTPVGAERAGNADGSIPAWTGGMTAPAGSSTVVQVFTGEAPLYTVDAGNMAQHQSLLTPGVMTMMSKSGYSIKVFPTHRTGAMPQYIYDNTAKNVTRAQLNPNGGRLGFSGAYGGVPFPIINTADPLAGGAQLIWNHLLAFQGYSYYVTMAPSFVVADGQPVLSEGSFTRFLYPYFDPNGSPETFQGYYSKTYVSFNVPSSVQGQEEMIWHSSNVLEKPDIVWTLVNGQGRVRKAPDLSHDTPNPASNGIANIDESVCFYGDPSQYDWKYIAKQEMLIPYNTNGVVSQDIANVVGPKFPNPDFVRWEKHRVWVLEATLHPGKRNVAVRRRYYLEEDSWNIVLGESYDSDGDMAKVYMQFLQIVPPVPVVVYGAGLTFNVQTGNYNYLGRTRYGSTAFNQIFGPQAPNDFDPQQMAASAAF